MADIKERSTIVIKVGTSTLTSKSNHLDKQQMLHIVQQVAHIQQQRHKVILVSSGAKAVGAQKLGFPDLANVTSSKQLFCSIGQSHLMHLYNVMFEFFGIVVAQLLLTRDDLTDRTRYVNVRDSLRSLLEQNAIPIINENDSTATSRSQFGDNDYIAASIASQLEANMLILLTDQNGLYTSDPSKDESATLIHEVEYIDQKIMSMAQNSNTNVGTGGMTTKIQAAKLATRSGVPTVIASGLISNVLEDLVLENAEIGTRFQPVLTRLEGRKRWLLSEKPTGNAITIDTGAREALLGRGASLLAAGIVGTKGEFSRGDNVSILGPDGTLIARGIVSYGNSELEKLYGVNSEAIEDILGYSYGDTVVHRDNLVLVDAPGA